MNRNHIQDYNYYCLLCIQCKTKWYLKGFKTSIWLACLSYLQDLQILMIQISYRFQSSKLLNVHQDFSKDNMNLGIQYMTAFKMKNYVKMWSSKDSFSYYLCTQREEGLWGKRKDLYHSKQIHENNNNNNDY